MILDFELCSNHPPTVELKWMKLPIDTEVGLNQDVSIECDAIGQPQPQITWTRHPTSANRGLNGKYLDLTIAM